MCHCDNKRNGKVLFQAVHFHIFYGLLMYNYISALQQDDHRFTPGRNLYVLSLNLLLASGSPGFPYVLQFALTIQLLQLVTLPLGISASIALLYTVCGVLVIDPGCTHPQSLAGQPDNGWTL